MIPVAAGWAIWQGVTAGAYPPALGAAWLATKIEAFAAHYGTVILPAVMYFTTSFMFGWEWDG